MIASNIFTMISDFFTEIVFAPMNDLYYDTGWWAANGPSWLFIIIACIAFVYWCGQLMKFKKEGTE